MYCEVPFLCVMQFAENRKIVCIEIKLKKLKKCFIFWHISRKYHINFFPIFTNRAQNSHAIFIQFSIQKHTDATAYAYTKNRFVTISAQAILHMPHIFW